MTNNIIPEINVTDTGVNQQNILYFVDNNTQNITINTCSNG